MTHSMHNSSNFMRADVSSRKNSGFTLLEIMIALVLGLLLSIGIISLFGNVSQVNRAQGALALLQENGRYAMTRIIDDLRSANGQYCSNSGGAGQLAPGVGTKYSYQDTLRAPTVYAKTLSLPDWGAPSAPTGWAANTPYPLTPRYFLQGYACPLGTCTPTVPTSLPVIGTTAGQRAAGADVLTVRALRGAGWSITNLVKNGNYIASADVAVPTDHPLNFDTGNRVLLADCSSSRIAAGTVAAGSGTGTFTPLGNFDDTKVAAIDATGDARIFNFAKDFRTVTYYLGIQNDAATSGRKLSSLFRRVNGGAADAIVEGVERLDFRYGVESFTGATYFLTAAQINSNSLGLPCPPPPPGFDTVGALDAGCLWRAVKSIEVSLLLNSVNDLPLTSEEQKYIYSPISSTVVQTPAATLPSGLPKGRMMRREFRALVSVRNYIP